MSHDPEAALPLVGYVARLYNAMILYNRHSADHCKVIRNKLTFLPTYLLFYILYDDQLRSPRVIWNCMFIRLELSLQLL